MGLSCDMSGFNKVGCDLTSMVCDSCFSVEFTEHGWTPFGQHLGVPEAVVFRKGLDR